MTRGARSPGRCLCAALLVCGALVAGGAADAGATVRIGETFTPNQSFAGAGTFIQTSTPDDGYVVPTDGVITSWSFQASSEPTPPMKLKIFRSAGGNDYTTVGESQFVSPVSDVLNTFLTRIPVKAGDVPGHFYTDSTTVFRNEAGFDTEFNSGSPGTPGLDAPPTTTLTYTPDAEDQIDLSAVLELDEDHDGFGDETQDKCLGRPGQYSGCPSSFRLVKIKQKRGATKITVAVQVPGAGTVAVGSPGDRALASASARKKLKAKRTIETVTGKHGVFFKIKLTKAAARRLARSGRLKVKVEAVYTPPGGPAATIVAKKKLKS
jgi:hypothetical protein